MDAVPSNMKGRVELTFPIDPYQSVHTCSGEEQKVPRFLVRIKSLSNSVIKVIVLLQCFPQRPVLRSHTIWESLYGLPQIDQWFARISNHSLFWTDSIKYRSASDKKAHNNVGKTE